MQFFVVKINEIDKCASKDFFPSGCSVSHTTFRRQEW